MGAKILQRKVELNYRKGEPGRRCENYCKHFVYDFQLRGNRGQLITLTQRCSQIGLRRPRKYQVKRDHTCDLFDNSDRLQALASLGESGSDQ